MQQSDFDIFDDFIPKEIKNQESGVCKHTNITQSGYVYLCVDCGEEIIENISQDKEWRYYGQSDTKHSSDPNR